MLQSPWALASPAAIRGGQFLAHWSLQTLLPPASLSNVYSVMPLASTSIPPFSMAGAWARAAPA
ncbi:Uncharacterised protein [Bordetella pertussis]|nr:Uncharacterised protein [Bordetella pertussis]